MTAIGCGAVLKKQKGGRNPVRPPFVRMTGLWSPVRGHETRLADHGLGAGGAQAGRFEIRPGLLRAAGPHGANIKAIGLGEWLRLAGLDLRRKAGKDGESGGSE